MKISSGNIMVSIVTALFGITLFTLMCIRYTKATEAGEIAAAAEQLQFRNIKENKTQSASMYPSWMLKLNDNTYFKHDGNTNNRPSYYFPPLDDDEDGLPDSSRSYKGSMVTFYFLLGLFLLFSSMFFCWYFAHHESNEAVRRHRTRGSRRQSRRRSSRLVTDSDSSISINRPFPQAHHISVIMPNEEGYHYDPPPTYADIFASDYEKENSPYILPTYTEIMSSQKSLALAPDPEPKPETQISSPPPFPSTTNVDR